MALARLGSTTISRKADRSVVTEVDHATQAHILSAIADAYPDHGVCAEETVERPERHADRREARFTWVVDPLDGTRNFAVGLPCFSTAIAVLDRGNPVVGVVVEHNLGHCFTAIKGQGARRNDQPISVTDAVDHGEMLVGVPSNKDPLTVAVLTRWLATPGIVYRSFGTTAYHLALTATGALDAVFCKRNKIWDLAAGALIVTEAGGLLTDPFGGPRLPFDLTADRNADVPFIAGRPDAHATLRASIADLKP